MFQRLDFLLGKYVYVPPIIWWCQRTGISQYKLNSYGWMIFMWLSLAAIVSDLSRMSVVGIIIMIVPTILVVLFAIIETVRAAVSPEMRQTPSSYNLRMLLLFFEATHLISHAIMGDYFDLSCVRIQAVLIAEYALTIPRIPPRKKRKKKLREAISAS